MVTFNSALTTSGAGALGQVSAQKTNIAADPAIATTLAALTKLGASNAKLNPTAAGALKNLTTALEVLKDPMAAAKFKSSK